MGLLGYLDYDLTLTDEQHQLRDAAREFAARVLRLTGILLDALPPEALVAADSPLFSVLRQVAELGYTRLWAGHPRSAEWGFPRPAR